MLCGHFIMIDKRFNHIRSMLRRAWSRDPERYSILNAASRPYIGENKRQKKEYRCNACNEWFKQKEVCVDHINPCGRLSSFEDIGEFCKHLFTNKNGLQVLCKICHNAKTKKERSDAKTFREQQYLGEK